MVLEKRCSCPSFQQFLAPLELFSRGETPGNLGLSQQRRTRHSISVSRVCCRDAQAGEMLLVPKAQRAASSGEVSCWPPRASPADASCILHGCLELRSARRAGSDANAAMSRAVPAPRLTESRNKGKRVAGSSMPLHVGDFLCVCWAVSSHSTQQSSKKSGNEFKTVHVL